MTYGRNADGTPHTITREDDTYVTLEYDDSLRLERETYYSPSGIILEEIGYTYDEDGNRHSVSSGVAEGTYQYDNTTHQLSGITTATGNESYLYDSSGRVWKIIRDGETLTLSYNANDQLEKVTDAAGNTVVEYTYDSQGRRIEVDDRDFVIAPMVGTGLDSPHLVTDGTGEVVSRYVYAGAMPLMRLDENGTPVYYLADAMGSVIGLADNEGVSAASFHYDSFGNLRGSDELPELAGGDFRFQGHWLEESTDLYHFRARYYDPEVGRFISRDPVDLIETTPESSNPYQFVYNNPLVYLDPTGAIVNLSDVSLSRVINNVLDNIHNKYKSQTTRKAINKAKGILTDVFSSAIEDFVPYNIDTGKLDSTGEYVTGGILETMLKGTLCEIAGRFHGSFKNKIWFEPALQENGRVERDGFTCGPSSNQYKPNYTRRPQGRKDKGLSFPDFLIRSQAPTDGDRYGTGALSTTVPPAYLIGDFKRTTKKSTLKIGKNQWNSILNYAQSVWAINQAGEPGHQYIPVALYVTLESQAAQVAYARKKAMKNGRIDLRIVSFFNKK
ncbi:MAG: RHS repeat-associated core domain-containing protein [Kamptonema sp. SIO1D9]|nr:RHS repeat-associated core domain-containing protein [Kamptonema sp. SIO1D9]